MVRAISILFFRKGVANFRTLLVLLPVLRHCREHGVRVEFHGGSRESELSSSFLSALGEYGVAYRRFPHPLAYDEVGGSRWTRLPRWILNHRRAERFFARLDRAVDAHITVSNCPETQVASRIAGRDGIPFYLLQWAPTFYSQEQIDRFKGRSARRPNFKQAMLRWIQGRMGVRERGSNMDLSNATGVFWSPQQVDFYRSQKHAGAVAPFAVPHLDTIIRLGRTVRPEPGSVLYVMGYSVSGSEDYLAFPGKPGPEVHYERVRKVFDAYARQHGCTRFSIKLRPSAADKEAFGQEAARFPAFSIHFEDPAQELMSRHEFVWIDYASTSGLEAGLMGRKTLYVDFGDELPELRPQTLDVYARYGVACAAFEDLVAGRVAPQGFAAAQGRGAPPPDQTERLFEAMESGSRMENA